MVDITINGGKTIVNSVGGCQPAVFKAQPREQRVRLNYGFHCGRDPFFGNGDIGAVPPLKQCFFAGAGNRQSGKSRIAADHGFSMRPRHCLRFNPGGQAIGNAGGKEPCRRTGADCGIHQHQIGIFAVEAIALKYAAVRVDHRQRATGSIGGGNGWHNSYRLFKFVRHRLNRVQRFAAAQPDHHVTALTLRQRTETGDLITGGLAVKLLPAEFHPGGLQRLLRPFANQFPDDLICHQKSLIAQLSQVRAQLIQHTSALHIFTG